MKLKLFIKIIGWLSTIWLLMTPFEGFSQSQIEIDVVGAEGQEVETDSFKVSYSVGEPRVSTLNGGGFTLTEGFIQPDLFALYSGMPGDSVWPGDANGDLVADMYDLLAIGIAYSKTGPNRVNASNNWIGQFAVNWTDTLSSGVNHKHVDCNGDGVVNPR